MGFGNIKGHRKAINILQRQIAHCKLAHAYMFAGPRGIGKATTAMALATTLQCGAGGDDNCAVCKRIRHANFPDVELVDYDWQLNFETSVEKKNKPKKRQTLGINTVKEIQLRSSLKAMEGVWKIFIIDRADTMTVEAANSFLKILEEPSDNTLFILIVENEFRILPTIRSRCQIVRFGFLNKHDFKDVVCARNGDSAALYDLSDGAPGMAVNIGAEGIEELKQIEPLWDMINQGNMIDTLSLAQKEFDTKDEIEQLFEKLLFMAKKLFKGNGRQWSKHIINILHALNQIKRNINARLIRDVTLIKLTRGIYADRCRPCNTEN